MNRAEKRTISCSPPRSSPATAGPEPAPKKRRPIDSPPPPPPFPPSPPPPLPPDSPPPTPPPPPASSAPAQPPPPPPAQAEILRRRRNREEIRGAYDYYRRIRLFVDRKDRDLMPDLEKAYLSLISISRGCTSVQRIVCELIPQYASYCPTALEAAAKVSIEMYKGCLVLISKGGDVDGIVCQTARACILGLYDICSTASSQAPTSSVIRGICAAVFRDVFTFLIQTFDGKDIFHIGAEKSSKLQDPVEFIRDLKQEVMDDSQSLLGKLFEIRALCLLSIFFSSTKDLLQACFELLTSAEGDVLHAKGLYFLRLVTSHLNSKKMADELGDPLGDNGSKETHNEESHTTEKHSADCFLAMAVYRDPSLRSWLLSIYKKLDNSFSSSVAPQVSAYLQNALGSLSEAEEVQHTHGDERGMSNSDRHHHVIDGGHSKHRKDTSHSENLLSPRTIGREVEKLSSTPANSSLSMSEETYANSCTESAKLLHTSWIDLRDAKGDRHSMDELSSSCSGTLPSTMSIHSPKQANFFDEVIVSKDAILVSKQLWVGSLGPDATETSIRSVFQDFGPVENLMFLPAKNFALVEYRNIVDAVKACSYMQGSNFWGGKLQIKYLDRLVGSRGCVGGVAVGESRHLYVSNVPSKLERDKILDELAAACMRQPCVVTDLTNESALLLEFETAVEAAAAKAQLRCQNREVMHRGLPVDPCAQESSFARSQVFVQHIDSSVSDNELMVAFSQFGEITSFQINRQEKCCFIDYRLHNSAARAKSQMHGTRFGPKTISIDVKLFKSESPTVKGFPSRDHVPYDGASENRIQSDLRIATAMNYREEPQMTPRSRQAGNFSLHGEHEYRGCQNQSGASHFSPITPGSERIPSKPVFSRINDEKHDGGSPSLQSFQPNWIGRSGMEMQGGCQGHHTNFTYRMQKDAPHYAASEWKYKEEQRPPAILIPQTPTSMQCNTIIPPPPVTQPYARPVYHTPSSPWDNRPSNPTSVHGTGYRGGPCAPIPFIPSSVTPLAQLNGNFPHPDNVQPSPPFPFVASQPLPSPVQTPSAASAAPTQQPCILPPSTSHPVKMVGKSVDMLDGASCNNPQWDWEGVLSKSGMQYCRVYARRADSDSCGYSGSISEPAEWPSGLEVTKRTDYQHAKITFVHTPRIKKEVLRLFPSTDSDKKGFNDFISYLKKRDCIGVIKVPAGKSIWSRLLFILPHSADTCAMLGVVPTPSECLLVAVLPKESPAEAM